MSKGVKNTDPAPPPNKPPFGCAPGIPEPHFAKTSSVSAAVVEVVAVVA
jgi:hypothetical protein